MSALQTTVSYPAFLELTAGARRFGTWCAISNRGTVSSSSHTGPKKIHLGKSGRHQDLTFSPPDSQRRQRFPSFPGSIPPLQNGRKLDWTTLDLLADSEPPHIDSSVLSGASALHTVDSARPITAQFLLILSCHCHTLGHNFEHWGLSSFLFLPFLLKTTKYSHIRTVVEYYSCFFFPLPHILYGPSRWKDLSLRFVLTFYIFGYITSDTYPLAAHLVPGTTRAMALPLSALLTTGNPVSRPFPK